MERVKVVMVNFNLKQPSVPLLPLGYRIRNFCPGDALLWAEIEAAAGEFESTEEALERFAQEFGPHTDEMQRRCLFLENEAGRAVGTATAWYDNSFKGQRWGRLHWVGIHPEYQGQKLARPLVAAALARLSQLHSRAYLTSQTTSYKAIKLYLDYGFVPDMTAPDSQKAWSILQQVLQHPALKPYVEKQG